MLKTLQSYICRELLKVFVLATLALNTILTLGGLLKPLNEEGLGASQVFYLVGYLYPTMLLFALPVAALFAATFVYGRLAAENELIACRSSGVNLYAIMAPAVLLALIVAAMNFVLANQVIPRFAHRAAQTVQSEISQVFFRRLDQSRPIIYPPYVIHADYANAETGELRGVVVATLSKGKAETFITAEAARVNFERRERRVLVSMALLHTTRTSPGDDGLFSVKNSAIGPFELPIDFDQDVEFFTIGELKKTSLDPSQFFLVRRMMERVRKKVLHHAFYDDLIATLNAGEKFIFNMADLTFHLRAERSELREPEGIVLHGVVLERYREGATPERLEQAPRAELVAQADTPTSASSCQITLYEFTVVDNYSRTTTTRAEDIVGPLELPLARYDDVEDFTLDQMVAGQEPVLQAPAVSREAMRVKSAVDRLQNQILAEIHSRAAFAVVCLVLVPLGAALGAVLRGGQILSAFTISFIPAGLALLGIMMGKKVADNPDVHNSWGLMLIWSGVVAIALTNCWVFTRVLRR